MTPVLAAAVLAVLTQTEPAVAAPPAAPAAPYCTGDYADDFAALSPQVQQLERSQPAYTFCIRTTATYECPYYGPDGTLRRTRRRAVAHGTGFAYQQQAGDTLLLTNQHVAEWPAVTDDDHRVDDVPSGCRRVADSLKIVDNDRDDYEADDLPLSKVVADPQLDMAVLRAHGSLPVIPWRIGKSAGLRERNVVDVRGFPLGAFKATSVGKVISAYDRDEYKDWLHDDFVVDALLSPGNSGSPVLAISCKTGELELVGVYHAGYSRGSALNVVVGVEQIRDLMTTLKRSPRRDAEAPLDAGARRTLVAQLAGGGALSFPFGSLVATAQLRGDGVIVYQVLNRDYPFRAFPLFVAEDGANEAPDAFGALGRLWFGGPSGLKLTARSELDADAQAAAVRTVDALRRDALAALAYQSADTVSRPTREQFASRARLEKALRRASTSRAELCQQTSDLADRLAPAEDAGVSLHDVLATPPADGGAPAATETGPRAVVTTEARPAATEPRAVVAGEANPAPEQRTALAPRSR